MLSKQRLLVLFAFVLSGVAVWAVVINAPTKRTAVMGRPLPEPEGQAAGQAAAEEQPAAAAEQSDADDSTDGPAAEEDHGDSDGEEQASDASEQAADDWSRTDYETEPRLQSLLDKADANLNRRLADDDFEFLINIATDDRVFFLDQTGALAILMERASPKTAPMDEARIARVRGALKRAMTDDNWFVRWYGIQAFDPQTDLEPDAAAISLIRKLRDDPVDRVAYMANSVVLPGDREKEDGSDGTP